MDIDKNVTLMDLSVYLKKENILIISDLHLGYEESLNRDGVLIPKFQLEETILRIEKIFVKFDFNFESIIINGDFKHEFGKVSDIEWRNSKKIIDLLLSKCNSVVIVKGNHDKILSPLLSNKKVSIVDFYSVSDYFICHGDKLFDNAFYKKSKFLIIGHVHPAVLFKNGARQEKYKCFLFGSYMRKKMLVTPSFNLITEGFDILSKYNDIEIDEDYISPYLSDISKFKVFAVSDKIYDFGTVKTISEKFL